MAKTSITKDIEIALWRTTRKIGTFGCFEVTIGWNGRERVDYVTYDTKGIWRFYEIKVSKTDFNSSAYKTFLGHFNYYVMPKELFEAVKEKIPAHIGVYVFGGYNVVCIKKPKKQQLAVSVDVLKDSMIRSLYRDTEKLIRLNNSKKKNNNLEAF